MDEASFGSANENAKEVSSRSLVCWRYAATGRRNRAEERFEYAEQSRATYAAGNDGHLVSVAEGARISHQCVVVGSNVTGYCVAGSESHV